MQAPALGVDTINYIHNVWYKVQIYTYNFQGRELWCALLATSKIVNEFSLWTVSSSGTKIRQGVKISEHNYIGPSGQSPPWSVDMWDDDDVRLSWTAMVQD